MPLNTVLKTNFNVNNGMLKTKHRICRITFKRLHPEEQLPMKLAAIKSENIKFYISFNNSFQGNGQKLSE